jgi:hypothetical protein
MRKMDDRQRKHNKRQLLRSRLRQHMRVLDILSNLPSPALEVSSRSLGIELASTLAFSSWTPINWATLPVHCEASCSFDAGTNHIKRRDCIGIDYQKGNIPSGLSKQERIDWYARHLRSAASAESSALPDEIRSDNGPPQRDAAFDHRTLAAADQAAADAADKVLNERFAQREARAAQRTLRKRLQVESFAVVLNAVVKVPQPTSTYLLMFLTAN